jgi:hypothetical protein
VDLTASEAAWVSVIADGKQVFAGILESGQAKVVEAADRVRVRVGNAAGLAVSLNGKPVGALGPRGQIRIVELTREGSEVLVPPKPQPEPQPQPEEDEPGPVDVSPPPPAPAAGTSPSSTTDSSQQRLQR